MAAATELHSWEDDAGTGNFTEKHQVFKAARTEAIQMEIQSEAAKQLRLAMHQGFTSRLLQIKFHEKVNCKLSFHL